jgi:DNA-binding NtrC family response regulator
MSDILPERVNVLTMKGNILLVANGDADSNAIIAEVAKQTGRGLRKADGHRQALEILDSARDDVDLAIVDLDLGLHGLSILETMGSMETDLPVIVVSSLEKSEAAPIASRHGAAACLSKPFTVSQLVSAVEEASSCWKSRNLSCDLWGHPRTRRASHS